MFLVRISFNFYFELDTSDIESFSIPFTMHYYCQCLNITIDILESQPPTSIRGGSSSCEIPSFDLDFVSFANLSEEWFECHFASEHSIGIAWHSLLQSINVRDMKLNRCLVCQQYTHISSNESNRILINRELLRCQEKSLQECYADRHYSKAMKIILPSGSTSCSMGRSIGFPGRETKGLMERKRKFR